jgi:hypothetical protein
MERIERALTLEDRPAEAGLEEHCVRGALRLRQKRGEKRESPGGLEERSAGAELEERLATARLEAKAVENEEALRLRQLINDQGV